MNHYVTLGIVAIVAAMTLTAVGFAIPQQALAYRHHNHNNHNNSIKVDQQVNQLNQCTTPPPPPPKEKNLSSLSSSVLAGSSSTVCINSGDNSADIHR
jgi:hypothetical protein